jgi:hypothetical protein
VTPTSPPARLGVLALSAMVSLVAWAGATPVEGAPLRVASLNLTADEILVDLLPCLYELRANTGRPHWIAVDEANQLLPRTGDHAPVSLTDAPSGMIYVTANPDQVALPLLNTVDLAVALGEAPGAVLASFAASVGVAPPGTEVDTLEAGDALAWFKSAPGVAFKIRVAAVAGATAR